MAQTLSELGLPVVFALLVGLICWHQGLEQWNTPEMHIFPYSHMWTSLYTCVHAHTGLHTQTEL